MGKIIKRKLFVNKKSLYRQIAQLRKAKWAQKYQLQNQDQFKFHFCQNESNEVDDHEHNNKNIKVDHKSDQKVKNRLAAQESREKRKNYLEELERKVELYQELLETQTCRHCHATLKDKSDTEFDFSEEKMSLKEKQMKVDDYFQEGVIRVDNQGANTPFAIFFFFCLIVILTIFTYHNNQSIDQRLLSNYDSLLRQTIQNQNEEKSPKAPLKLQKPLSYFEMSTKPPLSSHHFQQARPQSKKEVETVTENNSVWRKYGNLLCKKAQNGVPMKQKNVNSPFLMLRTSADDISEPSSDIDASENWSKGLMLTCMVSQ